jgi:hypothetical protein
LFAGSWLKVWWKHGLTCPDAALIQQQNWWSQLLNPFRFTVKHVKSSRTHFKTLKAFCYIVLSGSPWLSAPALAPLCTWELFVRPQHCGQLSVWLSSSVKQFSAVHGKTTLRVKQRPVYSFLLVLATSCNFFHDHSFISHTCCY